MYLVRIFFLLSFYLAPQAAYSLCVIAGEANLRDKPSPKGKLLWKVGRYMPLLELKEQGGWYLVQDLDRKKMWIHSDLVSDDIDCAVIKTSKANLRTGPSPGESTTPLSYAFKYMPFKKLQREEAWLYLQDAYGFKHWVYEGNLWEPLAYTQLSY